VMSNKSCLSICLEAELVTKEFLKIYLKVEVFILNYVVQSE